MAEIAREVVFTMITIAGLGNESPPPDWTTIAEQQLRRCWRRFVISCSALQARVRRERAKLLQGSSAGTPFGEGGQQPGRRRTGRPKKTEKGSQVLVLAALTKHHGYQDGAVTNPEPATN